MSILVQVEDLKKYFPTKEGIFSREKKFVHAVDGVSFNIREGETLGLVGESGCGKTTIARLLLRLIEPTSGTIFFAGQDISKLDGDEMRKLRSEMQIVFQDPFASLNPRKTICQIIGKPYKLYHSYKKTKLKNRIIELLEAVGMTPAQSYMNRYPHELSGGQRQRIGIARAIAIEPRLIVADEPVSSLDLSIQAQILNLMRELRDKLHLTYLFITHDLRVIRLMCNRVAVMYLGKIVEFANVNDLYINPLHPYTKALLSVTPVLDPEIAHARKKIIIKGEVPSQIDPPKGCRFSTRCPNRKSECAQIEPRLIEAKDNHFVACHLVK